MIRMIDNLILFPKEIDNTFEPPPNHDFVTQTRNTSNHSQPCCFENRWFQLFYNENVTITSFIINLNSSYFKTAAWISAVKFKDHSLQFAEF